MTPSDIFLSQSFGNAVYCIHDVPNFSTTLLVVNRRGVLNKFNPTTLYTITT